MWRPDPNDPLDKIIIMELKGESISFDDYVDAMDSLDKEPDCDEILQERGMKKEDVLREANDYRAHFYARLEARGLSVNNRFELCGLLCEQAQAEASLELLRIYSEVLCDIGFLLSTESEPDDPDERFYYEDQIVWQYLHFLTDRDKMLSTLMQRCEMAGKFSEVAKQKRSPRPVNCDTERKYEILQCFTSLFEPPVKGDGSILLGNLEMYMQIAAASPVLKSVEPLLLFRLLTRRQSYMCNTRDLSVHLPALWKRDKGTSERDNGRNYKQYRTYLQLFTELCKIYETDEKVDLPLCWYGLDQITVLGDFYRQQLEDILDSSKDLPFPPTIEGLVEDALFSCFENGCGDNLLLEESGLTVEELVEFQSSGNPLTVGVLDQISDYMNNHAVELAEKFLCAGPEGVKALCGSILENTKINRNISEEELPFLLSSINEGLMDLQDGFASLYLIQAGQALTDKPLTEIPAQTG